MSSLARGTTPRLPYYIVNAFTDSTFGGNPAAVMLLDEWLADAELLALAAQHNLSETGFLVRQSEGVYELRWFTPYSPALSAALSHRPVAYVGPTRRPPPRSLRRRDLARTVDRGVRKTTIKILAPRRPFAPRTVVRVGDSAPAELILSARPSPFVQAQGPNIKECIPSQIRTWEPRTRLWTVLSILHHLK